ncbi:MAG: RidA family protein [Alphaproteobacteria bacterium]|nr:RidA family protein [Alphaproteobacteria bacterium]
MLEDMITRFGVTARSSLAVASGNLAFFAVTPKAPYDVNLSAAEQVAQLFEKAKERLALTGSSKDKLLFVAIILADMSDYEAVNAVWDRWVTPGAPPSRACWQAKLASAALKVEMIMVAAR